MCAVFSETLELEKFAVIELALKVIQSHQLWQDSMSHIRLDVAVP